MSTCVSDFLDDFDTRWNEVNILIQMASEMDDNSAEFEVLCRGAIILMVANFEGFLTETIKCLIKDVNENRYFVNTSTRMKMTFCSQFIPEEKGVERRVNKLIETFDEVNPKYSIEPFLYENNKNPKALVIEKLFSELGGKNFFSHITNCDVEKVFENDSQFTNSFIEKTKNILQNGVIDFPYNIDVAEVGFNDGKEKVSGSCLWKDFINRTLQARHSVAHGLSQESSMSLPEIKSTRDKIKILELTFAILALDVAIVNT